jgi:hypothetical protein
MLSTVVHGPQFAVQGQPRTYKAHVPPSELNRVKRGKDRRVPKIARDTCRRRRGHTHAQMGSATANGSGAALHIQFRQGNSLMVLEMRTLRVQFSMPGEGHHRGVKPALPSRRGLPGTEVDQFLVR